MYFNCFVHRPSWYGTLAKYSLKDFFLKDHIYDPTSFPPEDMVEFYNGFPENPAISFEFLNNYPYLKLVGAGGKRINYDSLIDNIPSTVEEIRTGNIGTNPPIKYQYDFSRVFHFNVERIRIQYKSEKCKLKVDTLNTSIRGLTLDGAANMEIDFECLPNLIMYNEFLGKRERTLDYGKMKNLKYLCLEGTNCDLDFLKDMPKLEYLGLKGFNNYDSFEVFECLPNLKYLCIIGFKDMGSFNGIEKLEKLEYFCKIVKKGFGVDEWSKIQNHPSITMFGGENSYYPYEERKQMVKMYDKYRDGGKGIILNPDYTFGRLDNVLEI